MIKLKSPVPFTLWQVETLVWSEHAYDMQPIPTRVTPSKHYDALGYWQTYASISASKPEAIRYT